MTDSLADFTETTFTHDGTTRRVFRMGEGPAVIVMAEIPGITPKVADFARRVVAAGFTAVMPVLFGTPGAEATPVNGLKVIVAACVSKEFAAFATQRTAPVSVWLRALAADAHESCGGPGVGAVGMCFTGGFALGMMVDERMLAPVLSQPSLPIGPSRRSKRALQLASDDLARVKERAADGVCVLGLRFTGDILSPGERFARLRDELGDAFIGVEIDSSKGNQWGIPKMAHSVLTEHFVDEPGHPTRVALDQVLDFFREKLIVA
ncbi:MAG: dienelactone hydrolase family protein [Acidimicrobiales bacterium]